MAGDVAPDGRWVHADLQTPSQCCELVGERFVADVAHGKEIWNNAIYAYSFKIVDHSGPVAGSAEGTARRVHVQTSIRIPSDDQRLAPQWNPTTVGPVINEMMVPDAEGPMDTAPYANAYRYEELHYEYWLELDLRY